MRQREIAGTFAKDIQKLPGNSVVEVIPSGSVAKGEESNVGIPVSARNSQKRLTYDDAERFIERMEKALEELE